MLYREAVASQVLSRWYFKIFYLKIWLFWHQFWKYTQYHCLKLALWKRNIKKSHVAQDFCTVLYINKTWYEKKKGFLPSCWCFHNQTYWINNIFHWCIFCESKYFQQHTVKEMENITQGYYAKKKTLVTLICIITNFLPLGRLNQRSEQSLNIIPRRRRSHWSKRSHIFNTGCILMRQ